MDEQRTILLVVGTCDETGLAESAVRTAAVLAETAAARPVVAGEPGTVLALAAAIGLHTVELGKSRTDRRRSLGRLAEWADVVHAVGLDAATMIGETRLPPEQPVAVTVDRRPGRRSPFSALRNSTVIRWLVPGSTATTSLVHRGLVPGARVLTLPIAGYVDSAGAAWSAQRAAARRRLGVAPGAHVVVGFGPGNARGVRCLESLMARGEGIVAYWIDPAAGIHRPRHRRTTIVAGAAEGRPLLPAMDVLVADGCAIAAAHPAADARRAGVPIVSTATDVAAGFVAHGRNGYIAAPAEFDGAIAAALGLAVARTLHRQPTQNGAGEAESHAEITARCYSALLGHPLVRPVLMGRRAGR